MATPSTTYTPDTTPEGGSPTGFVKTFDGGFLKTFDGGFVKTFGVASYTSDTTPATVYVSDSTPSTIYTAD